MQTTLVCNAIIDDKRYAACQCQLPRTQPTRLMANYGKTWPDSHSTVTNAAGGALACVLVGGDVVDSAYETRAWHAHQARERLRDRQAEIQTDSQRYRQTARDTDRQWDSETGRQRDRQSGRQTCKVKDSQSDIRWAWALVGRRGVWLACRLHTIQVTVYGMQVCHAFYLLSIRR